MELRCTFSITHYLNKISGLLSSSTNEIVGAVDEPGKDNVRLVSALSILWLLIPYLIFVFTYYKFYLVIPTLLIIAYFSTSAIQNFSSSSLKASWLTAYTLPAIIAAIIFTWLSGIIPPLGMGMDWVKHFTILNVMVEAKTWPPVILLEGESQFLRYDIALYEIPAALEKLMPIGVRYWMAFYEIIGLSLFFLCSLYSINTSFKKDISNTFKNSLIIFIIIGFSGLDIVGAIYAGQDFVTGYPHLDWWANPFSFSANINQYFQAPQHCLPAWLGVSLLYLNARHKGVILQNSIFLLLFLIFFWSPLVFIGFLFLFPLFIKDIINVIKKPSNAIMGFLMFFIALIPLVIYFKVGISAVPAFFINYISDPGVLKTVLVFLMLEVFMYLILLFVTINDKFNKILLVNMAVFFIICTMYHIGFVNELELKGTMPALALLSLLLASVLTSQPASQPI